MNQTFVRHLLCICSTGSNCVGEKVPSACSFAHLRYWQFSGRRSSLIPTERRPTPASSIMASDHESDASCSALD